VIVERPLTIAEIFDRTVTIVVRRWKVLIVLGALTSVPDVLVNAFTHGHPDTVVGGALVLAVGADEPPHGPLTILRAALARFWSLPAATLLIWLLVFAAAARPIEARPAV
jgi:hypothetical protein